MEQNKKFFLAFGLLLIFSLAFVFSGCVPPVPEVISVTGVSITEEDQSIKVDETLQLTAVVTPEDADNKAVTWESDNADVAAVDENGLVTALKKGVANITVLTEDGAFSDTIVITVTKPYTPSTPTVKKYEVDFQVIDAIPAGINSRNGVSIDLSGFKIEIFTDAERLTKKTDTLTDVEGKASVKLPNGEYWFRVSKEGYADYPPEAPLSLQRQTQPGYFKVEGADVTDIPPIPMQRTYTLTMGVNPIGSGTASDDTNSGPYTAGTGVTISADAGEGYKFDSWSATVGTFDDNNSATTTFTMPASNATITANFDPTYTVTVASVIGGTATVVANPNSGVLEGDTVTVTISDIESGKVFSSIAVEGDDTTNSITTTPVTAGEKYTFTMPAEDVTVTVNLKEPVKTIIGDFETGDFTGWTVFSTQSFPQIIQNSQDFVVHSGDYAAYMGQGSFYPDAEVSIYKEIIIPADAVNPILTFYYLVDGTDPSPNKDWMKVYINDVEIFKACGDGSSEPGWEEFQYDLSSYVGTTIELKITSGASDDYYKVHYYIDDITTTWY